MAIVTVINLYTVRLVLNALGVEDYGIYNVVAGIITMMTVVNSSLTVSTQRFYSYYIGENNCERLKASFSISLYIYLFFIIVIAVLGETVGLWFVNSKLNIPIERMGAATLVYHISIISFVFSVLQAPFSAAVMAHENMKIFALITIIESFLKLIFAILLTKVITDRLIFYAGTFLLTNLFVLIFYVIYSRNKYPECRYEKVKDWALFKEMLSFSSWTTFASLSSVGMNQINTILINIFFGPVATASRAISIQVHNAVTSFSSSFITAIRPPMVKSFADGTHDYLIKVFNLSNKFIYYFMLMFSIPLLFEMEFILQIWLKTNDDLTVIFSRLTLIYTVLLSLNNPIGIIVQATGKVRMYNLTVETLLLLTIPTTYILFKQDYPAYYALYAMIFYVFIAHFVRLLCLKKVFPIFRFSNYAKVFVIPGLLITIVTTLLVYLVHINVCIFPYRFILSIVVSVVSILTFTLLFGLTSEEKKFLNSYLNNSRLFKVLFNK